MTRIARLGWMLLAVAAPPLVAQMPIAADHPGLERLARIFEREFARKPPKPLGCKIFTSGAELSFSLRFYSAYEISIPIGRMAAGLPLSTAVRVTPRDPGRRPTYLIQVVPVSKILPPRTEFSWWGGFFLGEGEYDVELLVTGPGERSCHKRWSVAARRRGFEPLLPPWTVAPPALTEWPGLDRRKPGAGNGREVTVLLHAAPLGRRRFFVKLSGRDQILLLESLTSLLDKAGFARARVVAFHLDSRRVLFESDRFTREAYLELLDRLEKARFGTIDYRTLAQGPSEFEFVAGLLRDERTRRSDAIVFLGHGGRPARKPAAGLEEFQNTDLPPIRYLALGGMTMPIDDTILKLVKAAKGKMSYVFTPKDLATAIGALTPPNH